MMSIPPHTLNAIISLIEQRLGLSATTLTRIGLGDLLAQVAGDDSTTYLQQLRASNESDPIWQRLIHALTIGETYFLRDKVHFRILRETILPRLILERRQQNDLRLKIWCMGCSTGEEAYSVATTLIEAIPDLQDWAIELVATDINQRALDTAIAGRYRDWSFRQTPDYFRQRYFTQVDELWQIKPNIQRLVKFQKLNALNGQALTKVDLIFARHMLMYFNPDQAKKVESIIHQSLNNGGWLLLGQAEALRSNRDQWALHLFPGTPIYQKLDLTQAIPEPISYPTREQMTVLTPSQEDETGHYDLAVNAIHSDDPDSAEQLLARVLSEHPDHAKSHILLAAIQANRQSYPEALTHLDAALNISGMYADAHYIKALIQLEQQEEENAVQSLSAAIYCQRNHPLAGLLLGNIYQRRKDAAKAARNWRNTLRAIQNLSDADYVSDVSDMTVARLRGMISKQQSLLDSEPKPNI